MRGRFALRPRLFAAVIVLLVFSGAAAAAGNPVTRLPVYPRLTDPTPLPQTSVCGKLMQGDFYIVMGNKADLVVDWYAKHLAGYKKYHAIADSRSQDTFFKSDGTQEVTVTGSPNSTEVYSISYGRFQPGLSLPQMASFNTGKQNCK